MFLKYPQLQATSTMVVHISYWNISNSHWEPRKYFGMAIGDLLIVLHPVIDPWTFTTSVSS